MANNQTIQGERIFLKPLEYKDALKIRDWGVHENKLFKDYNLADLSKNEIHYWYSIKKKNFRRSYYAIYNEENRMIGYLGFKDINFFKKESYLGIVLDPNFTDKGYGTESLKLLLNHYFYKLHMKKILLEVNEFNERAIHAYENIGFLYTCEYLGEFENQDIDFKDPYYEPYFKHFKYYNGVLLSRIYLMQLDLRRFEMRN